MSLGFKNWITETMLPAVARYAPVVSETLSGVTQAALFSLIALPEEDRVTGMAILIPIVALTEAARAYCTFALGQSDSADVTRAGYGTMMTTAPLSVQVDEGAGDSDDDESSCSLLTKSIALNSMATSHLIYMALSAYPPAKILVGEGDGMEYDVKLGGAVAVFFLYKMASATVDVAALKDSFNQRFGDRAFEGFATRYSNFLSSSCLPGMLAPIAMNLLAAACGYTGYGVVKDLFDHPELAEKALAALVGMLAWQGIGEAFGDYFPQKFHKATGKDVTPPLARCVAVDASACKKLPGAFFDGRLLSLIANDTVRTLLTTGLAGGALTLAVVDGLKSFTISPELAIAAEVVGGLAATGYAFYLAHNAAMMKRDAAAGTHRELGDV